MKKKPASKKTYEEMGEDAKKHIDEAVKAMNAKTSLGFILYADLGEQIALDSSCSTMFKYMVRKKLDELIEKEE